MDIVQSIRDQLNDGRRVADQDAKRAADEIERLRSALERISTPEAFYVSTSQVDPEALGRMVYANAVCEGQDLGAAAQRVENVLRERFGRW